MSLSNYLEDKTLDHTLGTASYTMPTVYYALFTTDPTDAGTGTEVSGGGYERQSVSFATASGGTTSNSTEVLFPEATASWGTVTHVGLYDALTGGNLLWHGQAGTAETIDTNHQYKVSVGNQTVSLD